MFILHILNNKKFSNNINISQILKYKNFIVKFQNKIFILKKIKKQKNFKKLRFFFSQNFNGMQDLIIYIVNIKFFKKNSLIYVTDIKGNLKFFQSTNFLNLVDKQKTKQPIVLLKLLKFFILNTKFLKNKPIALHFKNIKKRFIFFLVKILENLLFIKIIRIYNFLNPHNGCRPKKIKRKKKYIIKFKWRND